MLHIQIALSTTGAVVAGGWEYKLGGSTLHNGIAQHNTNKARVQAGSLRHTKKHRRQPVRLTFPEFLFSSAARFFFLPLAPSFPHEVVTQIRRYELSRGRRHSLLTNITTRNNLWQTRGNSVHKGPVPSLLPTTPGLEEHGVN